MTKTTDPAYRRRYHLHLEPPCGDMGGHIELSAAGQAEADAKVTCMISTWLRHWSAQNGTSFTWRISTGARTVASGVTGEHPRGNPADHGPG